MPPKKYDIPKKRRTVRTIKMSNGSILTAEVDDSTNKLYWFRDGKYITPSVMKNYTFYDSKIKSRRRLDAYPELGIGAGKVEATGANTPVYTPSLDYLEKRKRDKEDIAIKIEKERSQAIPWSEDIITLKTSGKMNLADIPIPELDSIAVNSGRSNTPIKQNLGLVGKESTFGGYSHLLKKDNTHKFSLDPHLLTNNHAYYKTPEEDYLSASYKKYDHDNEQGVIAAEKDALWNIKNNNIVDRTPHYSHYIMADAFKRYAEAPNKYNPGQGNYVPIVNAIGEEIWSDPQIQQWWSTQGKAQYERGQKEGMAYGGPIKTPWNNLSIADKAAMMEVAVRNGITTLPEIRKAYNEFAEGGNIYSEENKLQQDVNIYPGGGWLGMMPAMPSTALSGGVDAIRKRLYENITPFGYHDPVSRTFNAVAKNQQDDTRADENKKIKKSDPQASALDAIWATYLNIPENQRRKINSRYGISKTKDGYYRFNNPGMIFDFERDLSSEGLYSLPGRKAVMMSGILGNYTTGLARDKKGDYMFYSDSRLNPDGTPNIKTGWDINPYSNTVDNDTEETTEERGQYGQNRKDWSYKLGKTLFGNAEDISMGIGTAVPIYDKIYLDDYYGVPQKERGGNYLPEVTVIGKRKKKALGGNLFGDGSYMEQAKALIRNNEGWSSTPYKDAPKGASWRSVGYGFNDSGFREKYPEGISKHYEHGITRAQAEQELDYYLNKAEKQLRGIYGKKWNSFTDGQKAAILDTYYQRPASVANESAFYNAVMSGKDPSKYLGVVGFDKRNNIRRNTFLGGFSGSYDIPQDAYTIQQYNNIPTTLFAPSNPEVFFGGYKAPEIEAPLPSVELEDTPQYSEEEIARQERRERLNNLSMLMNLTSPQGSSNSMLDAIGLLMR